MRLCKLTGWCIPAGIYVSFMSSKLLYTFSRREWDVKCPLGYLTHRWVSFELQWGRGACVWSALVISQDFCCGCRRIGVPHLRLQARLNVLVPAWVVKFHIQLIHLWRWSAVRKCHRKGQNIAEHLTVGFESKLALNSFFN